MTPAEKNAQQWAFLCHVNARYVLVHNFHLWTYSAPAANDSTQPGNAA